MSFKELEVFKGKHAWFKFGTHYSICCRACNGTTIVRETSDSWLGYPQWDYYCLICGANKHSNFIKLR